MGKELRHFPKDDIQMSNKHMKTINITNQKAKKPNQIETTVRYQPIPIRMAIKTIATKTPENKKCWQGYGDIGTLVHCGWECEMVQPLWKTGGS